MFVDNHLGSIGSHFSYHNRVGRVVVFGKIILVKNVEISYHFLHEILFVIMIKSLWKDGHSTGCYSQ